MKQLLKRFVLISLFTVIALGMSGCGLLIDISTTIHSSGKGTISTTAGFSKDIITTITNIAGENADTMDSINELTTFKNNGTTYYGASESLDYKSSTKIANALLSTSDSSSAVGLFDYVYVSGNSFVGYTNLTKKANATDLITELNGEAYTDDELKELSEELGTDVSKVSIGFTYKYSVTFDKKVVSTNGKLSKDKKTVTWTSKQLTSGKKLYAYTSKKLKKENTAKVNIKNNKKYSKSVTVKVKSGKCALFLDGTMISKGTKVSKSGKHTLVVVSRNGNKKTIKFTIK